jgi:3D (Asp-Asp-Asp) domain-containing protein
MRVFLKRLTALAICVLAALPVLQVRVTAYAPVPRCTKTINPDITASGHHIVPADHYRLVAFSPDLAKQFKFGTRFRLEIGGKVFVVEYQDRMPGQRRKKIDFLLPTVGTCKQFGVQKGKLTLIHGKEML